MGGYAWVTLATNDSYSLGALVLAHSLQRVGSKHDLAVLITPGVTGPMREKLASVFNLVQEVNVLDSKDEANLALLARPELGITFTKLHCWRLTQYEKCVFIDADALVVRNCDELFEREELSAAPDVGWPDCFNSGVFVFKPSQQTFVSLTTFAASQGSFDGGDQGLLNSFFSDWAHKDISKHLPFIYNMCSTATYSYLPAFKQFGDGVKIIHFIGVAKPWLQYYDTMTGIVQPPPGTNHLQPLLQMWWNIFCDSVHPHLDPSMTGLAGALSQLTLGQSRTPEQNAYEEQMRKQNWEQGYMDYMGRDSFDNIWKKICETLSKPMEEKTPPAKEKPLQEKAPSELSSDGAAAAAETEAPVLAEETPMEATAPVGVDPLQDIPRSCPRTFSMEVMPPSSIDEIEELFSPTLLDPEQLQSIELAMDALVESAILEMSSEIPEMLKDQPDPPGVGPSAEVPSESSSGTETLKSTDSAQPVPIQVAESVLQAEPKESVSEDPKPLSEEVVSSIVAPVQESAAAVSEGLIEPSNNVIPNNVPLAPNGIDSVDANLTSAPMTPPVTPPSSTAVVERSPNIVSVVHDFPPAALRREEQTGPAIPPGPEQMKEESDGLAKSKLTVVLPETQSTEETTSQPATSPAAEELSSPTSDLSKSDSVESPTALSPDGPTRPTRSKDIKIPGTPIVIEATPPTSPPLDVEVEPESPTKTESKTAKEVSKSSSLEDESSGSPESERSSKKVKKVVKKTKKSKEGEEADEGATSSDVSKKLPKSTRKSSKPDITPQGLEADSTVPETPPPEGNSDTPVPPKRKTKAPSPQPEP